MADPSFDVVSKVDRQEVDNALNQAAKELSQRFDFRGTGTSIAWAKSPCAHVGPTRDAICVCNQRYCRVEPGTQYQFDARFGVAKPLTASGALGLWQPVTTRRAV